MAKQTFNPAELPRAIGPYSWATRHGNLIFLAGTASIGADGQLIGANDIRMQTQVTLDNLKAAVTAAGGTLADIVKTTVYLDDIRNYAGMNEVYRTYFPDAPPARATLITGFVVPGILVEIEGIAVVD
jgi:2-iminobutanoate/2-iminopropanoate deaminase